MKTSATDSKDWWTLRTQNDHNELSLDPNIWMSWNESWKQDLTSSLMEEQALPPLMSFSSQGPENR